MHEFCEKHGFHLVCRAHQVMDFGYEFFCKRKLATVFTASNYCGDYGNRGSVLHVDPSLRCSLIILLPNGGQEEHSLETGDDGDANRDGTGEDADDDDDVALDEQVAGLMSEPDSPDGHVVRLDRAASPPPTLRAPSPRPL